MEQKKKNHWLTECLLALAAYVVLFFLMQYTLITAVLLAVPCIFVGARRGWLAGSAFLILCTALTWLFGNWLALLTAGIILLPVLAGWYLLRKKRPAWESLVISCGAMLASLGVAAALLHYVADGNVAQYLVELLLQKAQQDIGTAASLFTLLLSNDLTSGALSAEQAYELMYTADILQYISAESSVTLLKRMVETVLPKMIIYAVAYGGLCNYFLTRLLVKKCGQEVAVVPPVEAWHMPRQHGIYMAITLAVGYGVLLFGDASLAAPAQMLFSLATIAFGLEGISTTAYFLMLRVRSRAGRMAIALGMFLLAPGLMTAIGVIEQLFGIRKRFIILKRKR